MPSNPPTPEALARATEITRAELDEHARFMEMEGRGAEREGWVLTAARYRRVAELLRAFPTDAIASALSQRWRTDEPPVGESIIGYNADWDYAWDIVHRSEEDPDEWHSSITMGAAFYEPPTHWQPLPDSPPSATVREG